MDEYLPNKPGQSFQLAIFFFWLGSILVCANACGSRIDILRDMPEKGFMSSYLSLHFIFFLPFLPGGSIFYSALNSSFFSVG
jgi:hypothetical protein